MRASQSKKMFCKKAVFQKDTSDLQALLTQALKAFPKSGQRKETLPGTHNQVRLISYSRTNLNALYGIMFSYEKDRSQLIVPDDDEAEILTVEHMAPPENKDGKRREFLEGVLYFLIYKNHVLVLQSSALRSVQLEHHLGWLLSKTKLFTGNAVALADAVSAATKAKVRKAHAKEVIVKTPLVGLQDDDPAHQGQNQSESKSVTLNTQAFDRIKSWLTPEDLEAIKLEDALEANIECELRLRFVRSSTEKGHQLLDNVALALRHVDDAETVIKLHGGGEVKGEEIKLVGSFSVVTNNGIVDADDAFEKMHNWLVERIKDGVIEP